MPVLLNLQNVIRMGSLYFKTKTLPPLCHMVFYVIIHFLFLAVCVTPWDLPFSEERRAIAHLPTVFA